MKDLLISTLNKLPTNEMNEAKIIDFLRPYFSMHHDAIKLIGTKIIIKLEFMK